MAATFRVTSSSIVKTAAERRLPSTDSVLTMLKWVERHLSRRKPSIDPNNYRRNSLARQGAVQMEMQFMQSVQKNGNSARLSTDSTEQ
jgi:trehalose 6-phosphate synthase/phosphatase